MHFQTKISQITMYFQSKNTKNDAFSKYNLSYVLYSRNLITIVICHWILSNGYELACILVEIVRVI